VDLRCEPLNEGRSWEDADIEPVIEAVALILSQYVQGNPQWDGPKTVAAIRGLVANFKITGTSLHYATWM
jgi:hypothetical protein